ncbi:MAG: hypothetical protein ABS36_05135 [Acidobacteria bacterium SCN 69-37]|nr:MAG: hypothetical protein ABS36_05135 [Acidobacteria bacterium SCN 69-37]
MADSRREALKTIAWGVLWIVGAVAVWLQSAGNPIHDLRLALGAEVSPGRVTDSWEDTDDGDDGRLNWWSAVAYTFVLPDGREIKSGDSGSGRLRPEFADITDPVPVEVEYLASSPTINRLRGSGSQSLGEWLLRKVGLGGVLLVVFLMPGAHLLRSGIADLRGEARAQPSEAGE